MYEKEQPGKMPKLLNAFDPLLKITRPGYRAQKLAGLTVSFRKEVNNG